MDIINKKNIHKHKKISAEKIMPSMLDRLYTNDIRKRKEKQKLLIQLYTPSFTPNINFKNINSQKGLNDKKNKNNKHNSLDKKYCNISSFNKNNNDENNNKDIENNDDNYFYENNYLNVDPKLIYKKMYSQNINYENEEFDPPEEERVIVENAFRDRLFKKKKPNKIRRTNSVEM